MTRNIVKLAALPSVFGLVALSMSIKDTEMPLDNSTDGLELFYTVPQADELDSSTIFDETKKMFELAKQCKVDYDGWGTYFEE